MKKLLFGLLLTLTMAFSSTSLAQIAIPITNAGTTGTTLNSTAIINSSANAVIAGTSNTTVPTYIVAGGAGTSGQAQIAISGQFSCTMDSTIASAAGWYYVINSTTTAGDCHAQSAAPASGVWVIGFLAASSTTSGSTALVNVTSYTYGGGTSATTSSSAPLWLQFVGTGGDGAGNCSGNLTGDYHYTTFTVAYGNTCTVNTNTGLVIHATGACTIAGTLTSSGTSNGTFFGGSGGGGGGGSSAGSAGNNNYAGYNQQGPTIANGGNAGAASGGNATAGATPGSSLTRIGLASAATTDGTQLSGSGGGGGGNGGGAGGNPGAGITLICASFTGTDGTHTGSIITTGAAGSASPGNNQGAGGGGGGGGVIISSQAAVTTYPTITTTGGAGGSCSAFTGCGTGGAGGNGPIVEYAGW